MCGMWKYRNVTFSFSSMWWAVWRAEWGVGLLWVGAGLLGAVAVWGRGLCGAGAVWSRGLCGAGGVGTGGRVGRGRGGEGGGVGTGAAESRARCSRHPTCKLPA